MVKVLVTGGAGYIGAHTCKLLAQSGYRPVVYDNLSTGHAHFVKWGPLEEGDLHDTEHLTAVLRIHNPKAVIHFAASAYVGESMANPFKYYKNNVWGTLSLLDAMRAADVRDIVFSSSCATYGNPDTEFIVETTPQTPISPYGQSKLMIEQILRDLAARGQIRQVSLRYFNAAGADPNREIGEDHDPETHVIPLAIQAGMGGKRFRIFGEDFPTRDGTCERDYIDVNDLASAHVAALAHLLKGGASDFINLGTGRGVTVAELVAALQILGFDLKAERAPRREGDPARLIANVQKAADVLNWRAQYLDIKEILAHALAWQNKNDPKDLDSSRLAGGSRS